MKYFTAIVVLAAVAYARPEGDSNSGRDAREAIALAYPGAYPAYPGAYVAGAPVAYASHPAYAPVAYAPQPAYRTYAAPAAAPQYAATPIAYAAHPSYYNAYKTVHV